MDKQKPLKKVHEAILEWREECEKRGESPSCVAFLSSDNGDGDDRRYMHAIFGEPKHVEEDLNAIFTIIENGGEEEEAENSVLPTLPKQIADAIAKHFKGGKNILTARHIPEKLGGGTEIKTMRRR